MQYPSGSLVAQISLLSQTDLTLASFVMSPFPHRPSISCSLQNTPNLIPPTFSIKSPLNVTPVYRLIQSSIFGQQKLGAVYPFTAMITHSIAWLNIHHTLQCNISYSTKTNIKYALRNNFPNIHGNTFPKFVYPSCPHIIRARLQPRPTRSILHYLYKEQTPQACHLNHNQLLKQVSRPVSQQLL